jgi:PPP family 3-phenylpropionic acid transporter
MIGQIALPIGYFFTGYISDRFKLLRYFLVAALILHAPVQYALFATTDPEWAMVFSALSRFFFAVNFQLIGLAVLEDVGNAGFGTVRAWGTAGFLLVQTSLFIFSIENPTQAGKWGSLLHLATVIPAFFVKKNRISEEIYDFEAALQYLKTKPIIIFFTISFLFHFSFNVVDFYLGTHLKNQGGMPMVYGSWALAVILEIPFLSFSARLVSRYRLNILLIISLLAGAIRFLWLGLDAAGLSSLPVIFSQILHGLHFTGFYMGAILFLRNKFPNHLYGTGYGLYMALSVALGSMAGSYLFGQILLIKGFTAVFGIAAAVQIYLLVILIFYRVSGGQRMSER